MPPGEATGSRGGPMGYIWEARLDAGVDVWRDSEPDAGCVLDGLLVTEDVGTEVASGAIVGVNSWLGRCVGL